MSNTQIITIDNTTIKQDEEGRYCLNDLHKAAGGEKRHQPSDFLRMDTTKALAAEIYSGDSRITPVLAQRGFNGGTFVVKELVYAYAMWISPQFHLKVIRAYDRLATQGVAVADHAAADLLKNPLKYLEAIIGQAKELQSCLEVVEPKAAGGDPKNQPAFFMRREETKDLVDVLYSANPQITPTVSKVGFNGGTFVVKELVYAYATWIRMRNVAFPKGLSLVKEFPVFSQPQNHHRIVRGYWRVSKGKDSPVTPSREPWMVKKGSPWPHSKQSRASQGHPTGKHRSAPIGSLQGLAGVVGVTAGVL